MIEIHDLIQRKFIFILFFSRFKDVYTSKKKRLNKWLTVTQSLNTCDSMFSFFFFFFGPFFCVYWIILFSRIEREKKNTTNRCSQEWLCICMQRAKNLNVSQRNEKKYTVQRNTEKEVQSQQKYTHSECVVFASNVFESER